MKADTWIERVRAADAEAEAHFDFAMNVSDNDPWERKAAYALIAIAAELRAQRIARRPGAGQ